MQKNTIKLLTIIFILLFVAIIVTLSIIFRIKHIKNTNSIPTVLHTEDSVSSSVSSKNSSVSSVTSVVTSSPTPSIPADNGIKLVMINPETENITVLEPAFTFSGTSDIEKPLIINGTNIERNADGSFNHTVNLKFGNNKFTFSHKDKTYVYNVNYRYVVIKSYTPSGNSSYESGTTFPVTVVARNNSKVTAKFRAYNITLTPQSDAANLPEDAFITYSGSFELPSKNIKDLEYDPVTFSATYKGIAESFKTGKIVCKKPSSIKDSDPSVTPNGRNYLDVGSGLITEIVHYEAETFNAYSTNDWSIPTNNYLPKGTVDYSSSEYVYYKDNVKDEVKEYVVLRYGKQVYTKKYDKPHKEIFPVVKTYIGTLPDHNEIEMVSFQNGTSHSVLTLNTMWKAPFYFNISPQSYKNPKYQEFEISQFTANYIDITFCYATLFKGEPTIPADNPLFSSAEIIPNYDKNGKIMDYTLRLKLKKTGVFYGWNATYNEQGQLTFEFLNPTKVKKADNEYGVDLTGVKILIDVGHGGKDIGAFGFDPDNNNESIRNLILAKKLGRQLNKLGATVYLTREENITNSADDRIQKLKRIKPDLCIAIHHNANPKSDLNGFDSYYFTPFSMKASYFVLKNTIPTKLYYENNLGWHYYYVARTTVCPIVLTENGFMDNKYDYQNIINDNVNDIKAKSLTKGIVEYFLSIQ